MNYLLSILFSLLIVFTGFSTEENKTKKLHAVLIVGPLEDGTDSAIKSMNKIADYLESQNVIVEKFYNKYSDWDKIKKSAKKTHFFIYSGHGSTLGKGGNSGGLCIKNMISTQTILEELEFKNNPIVIFKSVCRGAGSSAGDNRDIGIKEATKRVSNYSTPFLKLGASCYYANNLGKGCLSFLQNLFDGKSLETCFIESSKLWCKIEFSKKYTLNETQNIAIASTDWGGTATQTTYINGKKTVKKVKVHKSYDIAYIGKKDFTLNELKE